MKKFKAIMITLFMFSTFFGLNGNHASAAAAPAAASIKMIESKATMYVGTTKVLKVKLTKVDAKKVKWQSSQPTIVSVDSKGQIKGIKNGVANISAYLPNTKLKATAIITVNKKLMNASEIFKKVNPSVVYIEAFNKYKEKIGSGSGVIMTKDGAVVTNHHVIVDVTEVTYVKIKLASGVVYETDKVIGYDPERDLVVLKIEGPKNFVPVELGDSDKIKTGEKIFALGSPLGIQNSVTEGIISNKSIVEADQTYIQFTAPISHGNSGGALVNSYGELVGINVAYFTQGQNMNLAIPVKDYKNLDKTNTNTLLGVNQEYFIPVTGEGVTEETEYNDDLDSANEIIYSSGQIVGQLDDVADMDVFYFLVTDRMKLELLGSSSDAAVAEDFLISLYDASGKILQYGEVYYDEEEGRYLTYLSADLEPGYYHLAIYAWNETKLTYEETGYIISYAIE